MIPLATYSLGSITTHQDHARPDLSVDYYSSTNACVYTDTEYSVGMHCRSRGPSCRALQGSARRVRRFSPLPTRTLRHAWPLLTSAARLPRPGWPYATRRTVAPRHTTIGPARRPTHSSGLALAATSRPTTHSDETAGWLPAEDAWATMQPSVHPA